MVLSRLREQKKEKTIYKMNHKWNYQPPSQEQTEAAKALAKETGISPILCKLLLERGITSAAEAKRFFRPQLNELHDPFLMKDMSIAVERLNQAMGRKERIMVYGDYDVDGCTSVTLVYKFLQQFYSNIEYYIPDRYEEGYGVSKKGIDYAHEVGVKLVIILDCGIKAVDEITYAKSLGIDFIISISPTSSYYDYLRLFRKRSLSLLLAFP